MIKNLLCISVIHAVLVGSSLAQPPAVDPVSTIPTLLGEHTVAAVRLDLDAVDPVAAVDWFLTLMSDSQQTQLASQGEQIKTQLSGWLEKFRAGGVEDLFLVFDLDDIGRQPAFYLVAPGDGLMNPDLQQFLESGLTEMGRTESRVIRGCTVLADPRTLDRLASSAKSPEPGWNELLESMSPGFLHLALKPYRGWERVVDELQPTLPQAVGGGSSRALTRGLVHAWISVTSPPKASIRARIQSQSTEDAEALRQVVIAGLRHVSGLEQVQDALPSVDQVLDALVPVVQGKGLTIDLDDRQLVSLISSALADHLAESKDSADHLGSMNNLKQIGLGVHLYANEHQGQMPGSLADLLAYIDVEGLVHPAHRRTVPSDIGDWPTARRDEWVENHASYVYVRAGDKLSTLVKPGKIIVAHERPELKGEGGPILAAFADGHVEAVANQDELERKLGPGHQADEPTLDH